MKYWTTAPNLLAARSYVTRPILALARVCCPHADGMTFVSRGADRIVMASDCQAGGQILRKRYIRDDVKSLRSDRLSGAV